MFTLLNAGSYESTSNCLGKIEWKDKIRLLSCISKGKLSLECAFGEHAGDPPQAVALLGSSELLHQLF